MNKRPPRFYFSFRSPYSWIAARQFEQQAASLLVNVEYIPFWEPDAHTLALLAQKRGSFLYQPMSQQKHRYILQDIKRITTKLGYRMAWPIDRDPWWELPHLAYIVARRAGKAHAFFWAVYRARWEEGRDICAPETIADLAGSVGLDPNTLIGAPDDPEIRKEGAEALYRCYLDDVFGVPFFINGREKFWGIDRLADFIASLHPQVEPRVPLEPIDRAGIYDTDHAGGCG